MWFSRRSDQNGEEMVKMVKNGSKMVKMVKMVKKWLKMGTHFKMVKKLLKWLITILTISGTNGCDRGHVLNCGTLLEEALGGPDSAVLSG